ncbi:MAG: aspartate aminotransferase family protein [Ilumatobacter sp.]|nr:aspartate aminotransferase family protein [Ilumatobacter sp.]
MTPEEFRQHGHELIDWIADYIDGVGDRPVVADLQPGDVRARLPEHPPSSPEPFADVLADVDEIVVPGLTHWQHPDFFAWFPSNTTYPSILGELMAAGLGINAMAWVTSPAATELETLMLDWMQELLALPERFRSTSEHGGGVIQGTASESSLIAMLAARWRVTGGVVNTDGDTTRLVGYCTAQAHSSIEKGFRIAGIGTDRMRVVPHDDQFAMRPDALAELVAADVAAGLTPFIVVTTHGTTSSMAFDPTPEVAEICRAHDIWLHVDAAMSGIAALAPEHRWVNAGLDAADSYCTNPHKWMGINFDCNLFWTADRAALIGALSVLPPYLQSAAAGTGAAIDYRDWGIPLGRRFRALKLWFALRTDGVGPVQDMIREHVAITQELAALVEADDRFEIVAPHPLNLLCIARTGDTVEATNAATDALIDAAHAAGAGLFTRTVLDGRSVMRISIGSRTTTRDHVLAMWAHLSRLA